MNNIHIGYSNDVIIDIANGEYSLYLRKSRADLEAEERGEGETLARHEKMLIELARRYGFSIGKIYREIVSGESIESRPVVQELLRDVESGRWKGVLVVEVERLARGDTMDQGRVAKSFKFSNTKIITPIKIYDPNNEFDEEYFEFGLFMSRREYKTINRRLQRGRVSSVKEGKFVGSVAPYGYDRIKLKKDKGFTLIKNDEAPTVEKMFNLYAYNDISINEVVRQLNIGGYKPRKTDEWTISAVKDILSNPVYIGKIRWDSRKTVKEYKNGRIVNTRPRNSDYILCDGLHEPIIDMDTWNIVQEKRSKHTPAVIHNKVVQNPLVGIVYCSKCGKVMQRRPYKAKGWEPTLMCPNKDCDNVSSKLCIVEEKIISSLKDWLKDYRIDYDDFVLEAKNKKRNNYEESIANLKKELEVQNKKLANVYDFFEEGTYTREMFSERCQLISATITNLELNIEEFEKQIELEDKKDEGKRALIPKVENVLDLYPNLQTAEQKNNLLKTIVKRVEYLKTEKAIKKDSDPTNFELDIYPNLG